MEKTGLHYLAKHMQLVFATTQLLIDFFSEVLYKNWEAVEQKRVEIIEKTHQVRESQQEAIQKLPQERSSIISRKSIIELLQLQTKIANKVQGISGLVIGRQLHLPPEVGVEFFPLLNQCVVAVQQMQILINHLADLNAGSSREKVIEQLQTMIEQVDLQENASDKMQIQARNALLNIESQLPPVDVMNLYKMLEWTGDLADRAHELGGHIISTIAG